MLISIYTTKGGGSKTTSTITLLSTLAQYNSVNPEKQVKVLALDLDNVQGSLAKFAQTRMQYERPDHNITFMSEDPTTLTPSRFAELSNGYDVTIVDVPGFYHEGALRSILISDVIIVPSNLSVIEYAEANDCLNTLTELREKTGVPGYQALLLTRTSPVLNMTPKFSKILFKEMLESPYPILNAKLSLTYAYQLQMDYGAYLFELEDDGGKSVYKALEEANCLLQAVTNYTVVDKSKLLTYQQHLNLLGKSSDSDA